MDSRNANLNPEIESEAVKCRNSRGPYASTPANLDSTDMLLLPAVTPKRAGANTLSSRFVAIGDTLCKLIKLYWLPSSVFFIVVRASCRFETDRPTATFRTIDPLAPVRPACSDPMAIMR